MIKIVNYIQYYGEEIYDEKVIKKILISLHEKYKYIVVAIENLMTYLLLQFKN